MVCFLRNEHVYTISLKISLRHAWERGDEQFCFEASQGDKTEVVQPNRVYFRPALINIGHVLFMCLETITCITSQYEIDPLAIRDN